LRHNGIKEATAMAQVRNPRYRWVYPLALSLGLFGLPPAAGSEPDLTPADRQKLEAQAKECSHRSDQFYGEGKLADALKEDQKLLSIEQRLYPPSKYPDGHPDVARTLDDIAVVLHDMGRHEPALDYGQQALAMRRRLYPASKYPDGHPLLAHSLINVGSVLEAMGRPESALDYHQQALAMERRLFPESKYPDGDRYLAASLNSLGTVLEAMGRSESALGYFQQALAMYRRLYPESKYPDGHTDLAMSLNNLGGELSSTGRPESALGYHQQALAMYRRLYPESKYPDGHPYVARTLNNVGYVLCAMGRHELGLEYYQQAQAMQRRLYPAAKYPDGHPDLAVNLNNLAGVLEAMGRPEPALDYHQQSLAMRRRLYPASKYPDGHPQLAASLNGLGFVLHAMGRPEPARDCYEQALAMRRRLYPASKYPDGHTQLAASLNNLGGVLHAMGRLEAALDYRGQAVAMRRRLYPASKYPDGHPELARSLNNLGIELEAMGRPEPARDCYKQALAMYVNLLRTRCESATEAEALAFQRSLPMTLDRLLSATQTRGDSPGRVWPLVWRSRSAVARISEARHDALVATGLPGAAREQMERLLGARRQLARLLLQSLPTAAEARESRDRRVRELTEEKERLERELARLVPAVAERQKRDRVQPADLERALPPHTAYVDLLRYTHFRSDSKRPGTAGETEIPHYVAFVVGPGRPVRRVELGEAAPIEEALADWRHAIDLRRDSAAAQRLRHRVWEPIAQHLAPDTQAVYLVPDGALARLPWAALPGSRPGRVLLEELAVAVVPHGPFLVQQLLRTGEPRAEAAGTGMLIVGGVQYDEAPTTIDRPRDELLALGRHPDRGGDTSAWPYLPGTERELRLLRRLAGADAVEVRGAEASSTRLVRELSRARLAHLGTHGFFNEREFRDEQKRAAEAIRNWQFSMDGPRGLGGAGAGAKHPLSYTGLVLAGANHPERAGPDGGILTGEMLLGIDLRLMDLAVLSACQTGLGDVADGQCVQNLQRAFHVAGCRNVVASLWNVPDEPTAALMSIFYKELLRDHKPPWEALRTAQLFIYRNPGRIRDLAERGAPMLTKAMRLPGSPIKTEEASKGSAKPGDQEDRRSPAKDWSGFVLSGPGR
jgi:tetratricopeptide (TPR) repeat protein